ncbi:MAG: hypothetical protein M3082_20760 [Candidatus Dormibacteraeota bacterium]|nr:hypothetical protein [Candidatus Dormibacteraeota bacterium]
MTALSGTELGQSAASAQFLRRVGGIAAVLLGAALLADIAVFAAYVSSTGVTVPGDNPASQPAAFAHQLANGAASPFWIWYLVLAGLAVFALTTVQSLADEVTLAGSRMSTSALGSAALVVYLLVTITSATVEREAGSSVLTQSQLATSIPVLFGVLVPVLLGSFNLLAAAWILAISWDGWRMAVLPRWLSVLGGLTSLVLLAGVTGSAGIETLAGPWLIAAGLWMITRPTNRNDL